MNKLEVSTNYKKHSHLRMLPHEEGIWAMDFELAKLNYNEGARMDPEENSEKNDYDYGRKNPYTPPKKKS